MVMHEEGHGSASQGGDGNRIQFAGTRLLGLSECASQKAVKQPGSKG